MIYYVFVLLALSRFHDVTTMHLKTRWNIEQLYTKDIEIEERLVYSSGKDTDNWIKEEPEDYYPEKEIREYLEAHPHVVPNYLFETSLRTVVNHEDEYKVCPVVTQPFNGTQLPDVQFGKLRYIVHIPNLVPNLEINYCNTGRYPERQKCSELHGSDSSNPVSCQMMNQTVQLLAGSFDNNTTFTVQKYEFNIPYYCTCMFVKTQ